MKQFSLPLGIIVSIFLIISGCESVTNSVSESDTQSISERAVSNGNGSAAVASTCKNAGSTGLTALYVNESVRNLTVDFDDHTCDMAIYFDENAPQNAYVRNTKIIQETGGSGKSTGIWNNGADVLVTGSEVSTNFSGQFVPIRYDNGATGTISSNKLIGTHRSGILVRGTGTDVTIRGNSVTGSGAKTGGWAENGIQVDQDAVAEIVNNEITGHWWDGESNFASTGLILFASNSKVNNNTFHNNEFSVYIVGDDNSGKGNRTSSDIVSQSSLEFKAYGALIAGQNNHFASNSFSSIEGTGAVGVYIFPGSSNNKVTGNRISGFEFPILDGGENSLIKGSPASPNGVGN